jgi:hypothetical protein
MRGLLVTHLGVPIGRVDRLCLTTSGDVAVGELERAAAYEHLGQLIRAASCSLWSVGFLSTGAAIDQFSSAPLDVLARVAALELELRHETGELVPTDFVNVVERPDVELPPVVFARLRLAPAGRVATPTPVATTGSTADRREA